MKTLGLTYLLLLCCNLIFGQDKTLILLGTTGSFLSNSNYSISSSIGEVAVISEIGDAFTVTQGFQQPDTSVRKGQDCPPNCSYSFKVYPNPSTDKFNIEFYFPESSDFYVEIYNMKGSMINLYHFDILSYGEKKTIDFTIYPKGLYFFKIYSPDGKALQKYKVVKM